MDGSRGNGALSLSRHELWYGRAQEPVARRALVAGDLTVEVEEAEIRAVRAGETEVLRGIYMAVRDEEWGTVPGTLSGYSASEGPDGFAIEFEMAHREGPLSFTWKGRIAGEASGALSYELDGVAETAFRYCRIGFCLLHPPAETAGQPYRGVSPDGPVEGLVPRDIGPQLFEHGLYWPLFASVSELELTLARGGAARMVFEGDLFEMEDQRNWTDASFKTYCTPQSLGYPFDAAAGQRFRQKITLEVARPAQRRATRGRPTVREARFDSGRGRPRLAIGHALPRSAERLSDAELALLRVARPSHLRVDLRLADAGYADRLGAAAGAAGALGCSLEVAAFAQEASEIEPLVERLAGLAVVRLLLFVDGAEMSDPAMTRAARRAREQRGLAFAVIGGTDLWFAELNRDRPDTGAMDGLVYSITPQVHAFDEESIAQSLEAQPDTLRTAATFANGLPLVVSPVTLRPRDPIGTEPWQPGADGALPFSVDPRQASLFAGAWTVGSIAALAAGGAASVTFYETTGCRGIVPGDGPIPERFAGPQAGGAFAAFHVFADLMEMGEEATLLDCDCDAPSELAVLAVSAGERLRVLAANLTPRPLAARVGGFPGVTASLRMLDETTANHALGDPLAYRSAAGATLALSGGSAPLELAPFAIARLDLQRRG